MPRLSNWIKSSRAQAKNKQQSKNTFLVFNMLVNLLFFRVFYKTKKQFMRIAQKLGIMDDFKSGVPRMAYKVKRQSKLFLSRII